MRVLVAEDDPVSQRILVATLRGLQHQVSVAEDGEQAWARMLADPADVVITDWMMPRADGLELTRRIRARVGERYTWVVVLTALRGRQRMLDGLDAGADDFLSKPVDKRHLEVRLRVAERVLGLHHEVRRLQGLLPICSYCKRIRDGEAHWCPVEEYVARRSDAQFSHGVCPECYEQRLKPQLESARLLQAEVRP